MSSIFDGLTLEESQELLGIKPNIFSAYREFKDWWLETQAQFYVDTFWGSTEHECFATYLETLSKQEFIELLEAWESE